MLLQKAGDAILLVGEGGRILEANAQAAILYGCEQEALESLSVMDIRGPTDLANFPAQFQSARGAGECRFETIHRRMDGTEFPVEVSTRRVEWEGQCFLLSFIRDISVRRRQEARIARMDRLYAALSQVNQSIVWSGTEEELLERIPRVLVEHGGFPLALIGRRDDCSGAWSWTGHRSPEAQAFDPAVTSDGSLEKVLEGGGLAAVINDLSLETRSWAGAFQAGYQGPGGLSHPEGGPPLGRPDGPRPGKGLLRGLGGRPPWPRPPWTSPSAWNISGPPS